MRLTLPAIVVLCLAKHLSASPPQNSPENLSATAAAYMQTLEREEGFSGAVLLARDGKILFAHAYGFTDLDGSRPDIWRYFEATRETGRHAADLGDYR